MKILCFPSSFIHLARHKFSLGNCSGKVPLCFHLHSLWIVRCHLIGSRTCRFNEEALKNTQGERIKCKQLTDNPPSNCYTKTSLYCKNVRCHAWSKDRSIFAWRLCNAPDAFFTIQYRNRCEYVLTPDCLRKGGNYSKRHSVFKFGELFFER